MPAGPERALVRPAGKLHPGWLQVQVHSADLRSAAGSCVAALTQVTVDSVRWLVAAQEHGAWSTMRSPPGLNALAGHGWATDFDAVSCSAAGVCLVVGRSWLAGAFGSPIPYRPF